MIQIHYKGRAEGAKPDVLLSCRNPIADIWEVRYGVKPREDLWEWGELHVSPRPSAEWIKSHLCALLKEEEAEVMKRGFAWKGMTICLDDENKSNYQAQYIANTTAGVPLSVTPYFFGEHSEVAHMFNTMEELHEWYAACLAFGARVKAMYIQKRNEINEEAYQV